MECVSQAISCDSQTESHMDHMPRQYGPEFRLFTSYIGQLGMRSMDRYLTLTPEQSLALQQAEPAGMRHWLETRLS
jgi:hypothetical protein